MLIGRILGAAPSNITMPLTEPAVAASTALPPPAAGAAPPAGAAGASAGGCDPPPQLIITTANATVAPKTRNDFPFMIASSYSGCRHRAAYEPHRRTSLS